MQLPLGWLSITLTLTLSCTKVPTYPMTNALEVCQPRHLQAWTSERIQSTTSCSLPLWHRDYFEMRARRMKRCRKNSCFPFCHSLLHLSAWHPRKEETSGEELPPVWEALSTNKQKSRTQFPSVKVCSSLAHPEEYWSWEVDSKAGLHKQTSRALSHHDFPYISYRLP